MSPRGVPKAAPSRGGSPAQEAALRRQLAHLAAVEATPVYREMRAAAEARHGADSALIKAGNGRVTA